MANTAATTTKAKRRKLDQYYTPASATKMLVDRVKMEGLILDPCAGENAIADVLHDYGGYKVIGTDIYFGDYNDATKPSYWDDMRNRRVSWVVTNPPYNVAPLIVPQAFDAATHGVAFLLRLSYLEPCENRGYWLAANPPTKIIVMPRISFTGDGKVDSVTTAWITWEKGCKTQQIIIVNK